MPKAFTLAVSAALTLLSSTSLCADVSEDLPAAAEQVRAATALAGNDLKTPLFLCRANSGEVVMNQLKNGLGVWLKPVKLFYNLYYVGNRFVGSYVLRTSEGLILFDAGTDADAVRDHIIPGLKELGLDPTQIRYAIVTHGHWDHYGGGAYLQQTYGTHVGLGEPDWTFIETSDPSWREIDRHPIPKRDLVIKDGQKLTLGDTTLTFYLTPGHTHGTVSAIVPVRDHGTVKNFSLLGSTAFPAVVDYNPHNAGLQIYDASVLRFAKISAAAHTVALLNTHAFADGELEHLDAAETVGNGTPLLIGSGAVQRYYGILDHCLRAAIVRARAHPAPDPVGIRPEH